MNAKEYLKEKVPAVYELAEPQEIEQLAYIMESYRQAKLKYELPTEDIKKILWSLVKEYDVASLTCQDGEGDYVLIEEKAEAITNLLKGESNENNT